MGSDNIERLEMSMNGFYGSGNSDALMKVYNGIKHTEISEEFILPDYLPDIKKIIRADASPRIDGKYVSDGKISFEGEVACRVLYTDDSNCLYAVTFSPLFADGLEVVGVGDECIANLIAEPDSLTCRTVNPRRISLKLRLDTDITIWNSRSFSPEIVGDYGVSTEILTEDIKTVKLICAGENGLNASVDIEADGALPQLGRIICCDVSAAFFECKPADGRVLCRGEMPITVFYSSDTEYGEIYTTLFRKLPIAQVVVAEGAIEGYDCNARGAIEDVKTRILENGFGERRILELDITYRLYVNCVVNEQVTVTKDAYACGKKVESKMDTVVFDRFARNFSTSFSVNHIGEAADILTDDVEGIIGAFSRPRVTSVSLDGAGRKLVVEGNAETGVILKGADGAGGADYSVPFKVELEASGVPEKFYYTYDAVCMSARARMDSEKVFTDLEIQLNLMVLGEETMDVLVGAEFSEKDAAEGENGAQIRLFYPSEGETLWSIGKQFGVSRDRLAEINGISDTDAIPDVIMIPMK